ncbi:hypothetical protein ABIB42_000724 [Massilia sp. UYP32]|uniref:hypothetical protein n=1 Tax=Massilia sp. UYP32 TaxID=1756386 RepID=UPI003D24BB15
MAKHNRKPFSFIFYIVLCLSALYPGLARSQAAPSPELLDAHARLLEAETRQALAEAERAELLARLPPAQAKALSGNVDAAKLGAAGLARAFDLALELAIEVCAGLPQDRQVTLYDPIVSQGVVAARTVDGALARTAQELAARNLELQRYINAHTPESADRRTAIPLIWLTAPTVLLRAGADLASLFKSDATLAGSAYGDGARALFASALARSCPARLAGLSGGYMGELDIARHARLLDQVRLVGAERSVLAQHAARLEVLADAAKGELKKELQAVEAAARAQLKAVDAFTDGLRAGEASDKSPLFTAARYLGQAERSAGALVLDVDLRLEGLTQVRGNLFGGERLSLSGVAFLWYRLHEPDGRLLRADALRRVSRPVEVDMRGERDDSGFWR